MVEFMNGYNAPMDRQFDEEPIEPLEAQDIETPVIPISELGTTVADSAQGGNILQHIESMVRVGTKKIQLVIAGNPQGMSAMAGSYGKDMRREIKEKAKAAGVEITGVELSPQRVAGLSGFNPQQGNISEEKRIQDVQHVKDAVEFAADVAGGGGVDVWSNEFHRDILDAEWNDEKSDARFYNYEKGELKDPSKVRVTKYLIDGRTGEFMRGSQVFTNEKVKRVRFVTAKDKGLVGKKDPKTGRVLQEDDFIDLEGNYVDKFDKHSAGKLVPKIRDDGEFETYSVGWNDIKKETEAYNKEHGKDWKPEEYLFRERLIAQRTQLSGQELYWGRNIKDMQEKMEDLIKLKNSVEEMEKDMTPEAKKSWVKEQLIPQLANMQAIQGNPERLQEKEPGELLRDALNRAQQQLRSNQEQAVHYAQNAAEIDEALESIKTPTDFAEQKTFDSYAEAGLHAYKVTQERKLDKPVYVGPELGWAGQSYGGHPEEFIKIVKESRNKMAEKLKEKGLSESAAKKYAKEHIKGMLDTSHLTMWWKHFAPEEGESEKDRLKRFNEWTQKQVQKMVKEDVVGGVQIVDAITGVHAHLPPGQGKFDTKGMIQAMKKEGFDGPMVSEGHEEDPIQKGRMLTETWRLFGSPISSAPGQQGSWGGIQSSYFGHTMPTNYVVGGYSPSNDWTLWSETPLE